MEKIHNNLNIENLVQTDWINQFNKKQQKLILEGLEDNLDVSLYAKKEFNEYQMSEIRLGLIDNLDVSVYVKPEISNEEMKSIREELMKKSTLK